MKEVLVRERSSWAWAACLLGAALLAACQSDAPKKDSAFAPAPDPSESRPPTALSAPLPWTERFTTAQVLVADDVRIEGPKPLLEHVVTLSDPDLHSVEVKTTPAGLLQTITLRPGQTGIEIRAHVDNLAISALRRLTILERPGAGDALVAASGNVYWKDAATGAEQRGASLRLPGPIRR